MKEKFVAFSSTLSSLTVTASLFAPKVFAQDKTINPCDGLRDQFKGLCIGDASKLSGVIGSVINIIFVVAILAALFYLIYGGIKWLISEGDKSAVEAARQHIISAIIGLIIVFLSFFILNLVVSFFTGQGIASLQLPTLKY